MTATQAANAARAINSTPVNINLGGGIVLVVTDATVVALVGGTASPTFAGSIDGGSSGGGGNSNDDLSDAEIALIVVVTVLGVAVIILVIWCCCNRCGRDSGTYDTQFSGGATRDKAYSTDRYLSICHICHSSCICILLWQNVHTRMCSLLAHVYHLILPMSSTYHNHSTHTHTHTHTLSRCQYI